MVQRTGRAAAGVGIAAMLAAIGAGELVAALLDRTASPVLSVGAAAIDLAPTWAKETAIALFGLGDKVALVVGVAVVLLLVAAAAGPLEARRPWAGRVVVMLVGLVGATAALTRATSSALSVLPALAATVVGLIVLQWLIRRLPPAGQPAAADAAPTRRSVLGYTIGTAVVGALATVGGGFVSAGSRAAETVRSTFRLPTPAAAAEPVPASASLDVAGISPVVTPNSDFYRIDTALIVPQVDAATWSLRIHGMVEQEVRVSWAELLELPQQESWTTLMCVSNEVGGPLIGNARWLGYPIRDLLARARPLADADMVLSRSVDGFTAGTPLEVLQEADRNAIIAIGMNDEPLPAEHGFPARMVVPGLYGYVSATKWVVELEVTRYDRASAYWTDRGWAAKGPIKTSSRIDVPRPGADVGPGDVVVAGVAWHQHIGIEGVEVRVDGGAWQPARLASAISADTWVQWRWTWSGATAGEHRLEVRAIDAGGQAQTELVQGVLPDGATGLHTVFVRVA